MLMIGNFKLLMLVSVRPGWFIWNNNWIENSPFQATNSWRFLVAHFSGWTSYLVSWQHPTLPGVRGVWTFQRWQCRQEMMRLERGDEIRDPVDDEVNKISGVNTGGEDLRRKLFCVIGIMTKFVSVKWELNQTRLPYFSLNYGSQKHTFWEFIFLLFWRYFHLSKEEQKKTTTKNTFP